MHTTFLKPWLWGYARYVVVGLFCRIVELKVETFVFLTLRSEFLGTFYLLILFGCGMEVKAGALGYCRYFFVTLTLI